jgi:hypothetical protein
MSAIDGVDCEMPAWQCTRRAHPLAALSLGC